EVVAGDPAGGHVGRRAPRADVVGVAGAPGAKLRVDLALAAATGDYLVEALLLPDAHPEPLAVVGDDLQGLGVVRRPRARPVVPGLDRVDPARVVADVAADRAARVRRGVRP